MLGGASLVGWSWEITVRFLIYQGSRGQNEGRILTSILLFRSQMVRGSWFMGVGSNMA